MPALLIPSLGSEVAECARSGSSSGPVRGKAMSWPILSFDKEVNTCSISDNSGKTTKEAKAIKIQGQGGFFYPRIPTNLLVISSNLIFWAMLRLKAKSNPRKFLNSSASVKWILA